jgi:serine protease AprX
MILTVHGRPRPLAHLRVLLAGILLAAALTWGLLAAGGATTRAPALNSPPPSTALGTPGSPSDPLARLAATHPARPVQVIVQLSALARPADGRALVRSLGGRPGPELSIIHGLSARMSAGAARRLAASPLVRVVSLNSPIKTQDISITISLGPPALPTTSSLDTTFDQTTSATKLWQRASGRGVGVAVIDTGVDGSLPDFRTSRSNSTSRVDVSAVIDPGASTPDDTYGHGTLVAGLIGGNSNNRPVSDANFGDYAGTAPNANLVSIKVADDDGQSTILDAIYGLQFAVDHRAAYNIRVVNLSFRSTTPGSYTTDPLDAAVEQAWMHGIVVVAASGNLGDASDAVDYAPGNDPYALTVGATDEQGTTRVSDDQVASWSSRGQTQDGVAKPDVLAPGAHILSTLAPGSDFASSCPSCVTGGAYFQASGTSLAAPIVAGIAADIAQVHPSWTPAQIKGAIVNTATPLSGGGGSEVNGYAASYASGSDLTADQNLTPSTLVDPATGDIDYSLASWSLASWSTATDPLTASWSLASWSCVDCSADNSPSTDPQLASWSTLGWTTMWG